MKTEKASEFVEDNEAIGIIEEVISDIEGELKKVKT